MARKTDYIPIEGQPDLFRDPRSQAVLQTNIRAKEAYNAQRTERRKITNALSEIDTLKADMKDIKDLLGIVIQRLS